MLLQVFNCPTLTWMGDLGSDLGSWDVLLPGYYAIGLHRWVGEGHTFKTQWNQTGKIYLDVKLPSTFCSY